MEECLLGISPAWCGQFMKIRITLEPYGIFYQTLHTYLFYQTTGMPNGDYGLPSIILACRGILVKMLITHEPHGKFYSNFAYLYIWKYICLKHGHILSELISWIIVSAFLETINFKRYIIWNPLSYGTYFRTAIRPPWRSRRGVGNKPLFCKPGVASSIPGSS